MYVYSRCKVEKFWKLTFRYHFYFQTRSNDSMNILNHSLHFVYINVWYIVLLHFLALLSHRILQSLLAHRSLRRDRYIFLKHLLPLDNTLSFFLIYLENESDIQLISHDCDGDTMDSLHWIRSVINASIMISCLQFGAFSAILSPMRTWRPTKRKKIIRSLHLVCTCFYIYQKKKIYIVVKKLSACPTVTAWTHSAM